MGTIRQEFTLESAALMTGVKSKAKVCPSLNKGIRFHFENKVVLADIDNVVSTEHCTVIGKDNTKIMLIEHFMAACAICKIDSLDIYLSHFELPILDGASKIWTETFKNAGIVNPNETKQTINDTIKYLNGKTYIIVLPSDTLSVTYSVNFNHKDLKNRWVSLDTKNIEEIAQARTFGYLKDLEMLQKQGFARGASLENTLGLTEEGYTSELKSEYEPIKHKILDLIGDFYLAGCNILNLNASIIAKEAGHTVHTIAAKELKNKLIISED